MDAARFDEPDVEEATVDGVDSAVADRLFRSGVRRSHLSGVVGVTLVRSVSLARPLRCFETFFDVFNSRRRHLPLNPAANGLGLLRGCDVHLPRGSFHLRSGARLLLRLLHPIPGLDRRRLILLRRCVLHGDVAVGLRRKSGCCEMDATVV